MAALLTPRISHSASCILHPASCIPHPAFRPHPSMSARTPTAAWLLLAPLAAWLLMFVVAPTLLLVVISFCERDFIGRVVYHFTWANYLRAFDPVYLRILLRSVGYAALTTAVCVLAGYPLAYFIARAGPRARQGLLVLVMVPFWTSFLIRTYAWITILAHDGLLKRPARCRAPAARTRRPALHPRRGRARADP